MQQRNKLILLITLVALITGVGIISQLNKTDFSNNLDDVYILIIY